MYFALVAEVDQPRSRATEGGREGGRCFHALAEAPTAPQARDDDAAARVWSETAAILARIGA